MALIIEIKKHWLAFKKAKNIIMNFVTLKYQATFKKRLAKEMWKSLKAKFQYIPSMSISRFLLKTTRIQQLECLDIFKYCYKY